MILPEINRITIENFSLYRQKSRVEVEVPNGVLCLAGANGLGKSTFISIVAYAMTGAVVQPDISFKSLNSIPAFAQKTAGYASRFGHHGSHSLLGAGTGGSPYARNAY